MQQAYIPQFFLYGDAPEPVEERFLHIEALGERGGPANWNIRPHTHRGLSHIFYIRNGNGMMSADTMRETFRAPCLLVVPSNVVHSFESDQTSRGSALTVSDAYRDELVRREPDLGRIFARPRVLEISETVLLEDALARLARELGWMAPAHSMAIEALLATVLIETLRLTLRAEVEDPPQVGSHAALVASFRALVEERYRSETRIEAYADAMNVQSKRLRSACMRNAGISPSQLIRNRVMLEAKRVLLYTNMTISETAYYLGYDDPAYFTRVFTKSCGISPKNFRKNSTQPALSE